MDELKRENDWLWGELAESDKAMHDEYCGGKRAKCFWCERKKVNGHGSHGSVTAEDINIYKTERRELQRNSEK